MVNDLIYLTRQYSEKWCLIPKTKNQQTNETKDKAKHISTYCIWRISSLPVLNPICGIVMYCLLSYKRSDRGCTSATYSLAPRVILFSDSKVFRQQMWWFCTARSMDFVDLLVPRINTLGKSNKPTTGHHLPVVVKLARWKNYRFTNKTRWCPVIALN